MIRLRFIDGGVFESTLIELQEKTCMPFTPSHVECVSRDGAFYIGQHIDGGMRARPAGYDTPRHELFVDLPATEAQTAAFYDYVEKSEGEPYDWEAILGFVIPGHFHTQKASICSAKMFLALRLAADWFPSHVAIAVPAHCISPRDLLMILSTIVPIPH